MNIIRKYYIPSINNSIINFRKSIIKSNLKPHTFNHVHWIIKKLFEQAREGNIYALHILNYMHNNLTSEERAKRKVTSRDVEDFFADLLLGEVADESERSNKKMKSINNKEELINEFVACNRRENPDLNLYKN